MASDVVSPSDSVKEPSPPPLLPPSQWRFTSLPPSTRPETVATPRYPGITADQLTPKTPGYHTKVDNAMSLRYHAAPISAFQTFVPGSNLPAQKLRKLGKFVDYNPTGSEHDMYPPLVRNVLLYRPSSRTQSAYSAGSSTPWLTSLPTDSRSRTLHTGQRLLIQTTAQTLPCIPHIRGRPHPTRSQRTKSTSRLSLTLASPTSHDAHTSGW